MTLDEIVAQARHDLDDEVTPYLYPDDRLQQYGDEAQNEACVRTRFLVDSQTAAVCSIALVADQPLYTLHPSIIVVRRVEFQPTDTTQRADLLRRTTFEQLDYTQPQWTSSTGRPSAVVQDFNRRSLRLDRTPTTSTLGTLKLTVWRKPLEVERLESPVDEPVIDEQFHRSLAHWICYRALLKKDGEANDSKRAGEHLELFESAFGPRPTAARLRELATDEAGEVRAYWL